MTIETTAAMAQARQARARAMMGGKHKPKWNRHKCADCGQDDPARLSLPVNREFRCKGGCDVADASASESADERTAAAALF